MGDPLSSSAVESFARLRHSVRGLANWILDYADELGQPITNMALNKLVFFAFEGILLEEKMVLTDAKIEAWDHGPVFREVYHGFKSYSDKPIKSRIEFYSVDTQRPEIVIPELNDHIELILRRMLKPLIPLSAARLRNISHVEGGAWHQVWCHDGYANPGMEITTDLIYSVARGRGTASGIC